MEENLKDSSVILSIFIGTFDDFLASLRQTLFCLSSSF